MESELVKLFSMIIEKYGMVGAGLIFLIWYIKSLGEKIDKLSGLSQKTYGAIMATIDKKDRDSIDGSRGLNDV